MFIDEHELTINDGCFGIANPSWGRTNPDEFPWIDFRADRHNNGANLSFADGHVAPHRWKFHHNPWSIDKETEVKETPITNAIDRADLKWLFEGIPHSP